MFRKTCVCRPITVTANATRTTRAGSRKVRLDHIPVYYHFGTYRNFKEYYLNWVKGVMRQDFPNAVSYNRFVELMPRVFFKIRCCS